MNILPNPLPPTHAHGSFAFQSDGIASKNPLSLRQLAESDISSWRTLYPESIEASIHAGGEDVSPRSNTESDIGHDLSRRYGVGVSAQQYAKSDSWNDSFPEHGEDVLRPQTRHRPRRTAKERRLQQLRSDARATTRMLTGLLSMQEHRGNSLSRMGVALLQTLHRNRTATHGPHFQHAHGDAQSYNRPTEHARGDAPHNRVICRHFLMNRCTWGDKCRFQHDCRDFYNSSGLCPDAVPEARGGADVCLASSQVVDDVSDHSADSAFVGGPLKAGPESCDNPDVEVQLDTNVYYESDNVENAYEHYYWCGNAYDHCDDLEREAACIRTRNFLSLFSDAADNFLAFHTARNDELEKTELNVERTPSDGQLGPYDHRDTYDTDQAMTDIYDFLSALDGDSRAEAVASLPPQLKIEFDRWSSVEDDANSGLVSRQHPCQVPRLAILTTVLESLTTIHALAQI